MPIRSDTFEIAALEADVPGPGADENLVELRLGEHAFTLWRRPSPGQFGTLQLRLARGNADAFTGIDKFLGKLMLSQADAIADERRDESGKSYADRVQDGERVYGPEDLWTLYEDDKIGLDTIIQMLRKVLEIHSGFPTESSPGSSPGRQTTGPKSTATSRRVRSTPSS